MHAEFRLFVGIVLAHAIWIVAYVTGTLLDRGAPRPETRARALFDLVVRSATGLALWGFGAFVLGVLGVLTVPGLIALLAIFVAAARFVHGPAFLRAAFWRDHAARAGLAFGGTNLVLYYAALAAIVPAALPDTSSDGIRYHLAYAAEWAESGRLVVDRFLRQPLYANNFLLVYATLDVLHLHEYVHFVNWLCGAWVALAVRAALALIIDALPPAASMSARVSRAAVALLLPLATIVSPVYLRWVDTGLVDVPMSLYAFVPILCAVGAIVARRDVRWSAACCAGFAIGMKVSLVAFIPLFLFSLWMVVRSLGASRRAAAGVFAVMLLAAAPWYVRNIVYDGDPIPPLINAALHRPDLTWSPADLRGQMEDLRTDRSPAGLATLPLRVWADPQGPTIREYGTVALDLLLYVPFVALVGYFALGARRRDPRLVATVMLCMAASYALLYCLATSYLLRYLLIVHPALAAAIGALLLALPERRAALVARVAVAALCLVPTPQTPGWYREYFQANYRELEQRYVSDESYLRREAESGYVNSQLLLAMPEFRRRPAPRALVVGPEVDYYFRRAGVQSIGDIFGPGRFADLQIALENDRLSDYVRYFDIGGVILYRGPGGLFSAQQVAALEGGLRRLGFRAVATGRSDWLVAVRSELPLPERAKLR